MPGAASKGFPPDLQQWQQNATAALSQPEEGRASPQETREDRRRIKELFRVNVSGLYGVAPPSSALALMEPARTAPHKFVGYVEPFFDQASDTPVNSCAISRSDSTKQGSKI